NLWANDGEERLPVAHEHWNAREVREHLCHRVHLVHADRANSFQYRLTVTDGIGEGHPSTRDGRLGSAVDDDWIAGTEQAVSDRGRNVADAAYQNPELATHQR